METSPYRINTAKLRAARESKGYSQKDMAKLLGYKYPHGYGQVERGERKMHADMAFLISKILDISLDEFFLPINDTNGGKASQTVEV